MIWEKRVSVASTATTNDRDSGRGECQEIITTISRVDQKWSLELSEAETNELRRWLKLYVRGEDPKYGDIPPDDRDGFLSLNVEVMVGDDEFLIYIGSFSFSATLSEAEQLLEVLEEL